MRAIYLESEKLDQSTVMLEGEKLHHLLNVVRIKKGQDILLLNGLGSKAFGKIESISKKNVQIVIEKLEQSKHPGNISVAFALPKKDALETALRSCVESGTRNIYILNSERSQNYPLKIERLNKILVAGVEQSNNPYMPRLTICDLKDLDFDSYNSIALASLKNTEQPVHGLENTLLLIGPEGGFTEDEESWILERPGTYSVRFDGPILRTQTAIPFLCGFLTARK